MGAFGASHNEHGKESAIPMPQALPYPGKLKIHTSMGFLNHKPIPTIMQP